MRKKVPHVFQLLAVLAISFLLTQSHVTSGIDATLKNTQSFATHTLNIITTPSYHTYLRNKKQGADGLAFQLIKQYAKQHNYRLNIILAEHTDDIFTALDNGVADIGLLKNPLAISRQQNYPQTQAYMSITTELLYRHGQGEPQTFEELAGKTIVIHDDEQYREKQAFIQNHYPDINWQFSALTVEELVGMVNTGAIDYTLIDSHEFIKLRALYTKTRAAFAIYYPEPLTLALSKSAENYLAPSLNNFIAQSKQDGSLNQFIERFYGHAEESNPRGSTTFFARVNTRLPQYQPLIQQIAAEYQMDWRLLAAIAYQESHWNPTAKSPTGVRGMMMLTLKTAELMGVNNRLDVEQSLRGGAEYYQSILMRLPESITQPDRQWFALASYNVGIGHVLDAREITSFHGGNADRWADVKKYLPLLEKEAWYSYTQYGAARGSEPVSYVQNIRHFKDLLEWRFPEKTISTETDIRIASVHVLKDIQSKNAQNDIDPRRQPVRLSALIP